MQVTDQQAHDLLRVVGHQAKRLHPRNHSDYDELFSVGLVGIARAIRAWRVSLGHDLAWYASYKVHHEMLTYLQRLPRRMSALEDLEAERPTPTKATREWWDEILQGLSRREKLLLKLRFLGGFYLWEAGQVLGVTESRACQLEAQALKYVRQRLQAQNGETL